MKSRRTALVTLLMALLFVFMLIPAAGAASSEQLIPVANASKVKQLDSISITGVSELAEGRSSTLKVLYSPTNTAYRSVKWTSSNPSVLTVSSSGKITAKRGTATQTVTVTAVSRNVPSVSATKTITVKPAVSLVVIYAPSRIIDFSSGSGSVALSAATFPDAAGDGLKWSSSNTRVATVDQNGFVTAHKKGTVRITAQATDGTGKKASVTLNVVNAVKSIQLSYAPEMTTGKSQRITATFTPSDSTNKKLKWTSSDTSIATVSSSGTVKAKKVLTKTDVVITAVSQEDSSIYAQATISILPKAQSVSIIAPETSIYMVDSTTLSLSASVAPLDASQGIAWSTNNKRLATVDANGVVTGIKAGKVKITAKATDGSGKYAYVYINVLNRSAKAINYRALLVGEVTFPYSWGGNCYRNRGDVNTMAATLSRFVGDNGEKYAITKKTDLSANGILSAISTAFAGAGPNDVNLFMIASHGDTATSGSYAGAISCYNGNSTLTTKQLADALSAVPGKVIVVIQTCGSGASIAASGARSSAAFDPDAFNKAVISAFASTGAAYNVGELRQSKFYVLTASQIGELSWGLEYNGKDGYNFFTSWLEEGFGYNGETGAWKSSMPADTDGDKKVTLAEAYKYVSKYNTYKIYYYDNYGYYRYAYQHVQVYPANSTFMIFQK